MNTQTQHITQYKNSPLGLIPEDWEVKKIGKITKTTAGGTPSTNRPEYWNGNIKWMSSGDLNLKRIFDVEGRITEIGLKNSSTRIIPVKCILIGLAGQGKTRGTVAMNMIELCTNQSVAAIFPSKEFYEDYLYYNLDYRYSELRQLSTGDGGRGGLNLNIINSIPVPIPTIPEQKAIAHCLSTWDKAIEKLNGLIDQKELSKKALMQQLLSGKKRLKGFGGEWKEVRLGQVCNLVNGMAFKPNEWTNSGIPIIRIQNLNGSDDFNYFDGEIQSRYFVNHGDLLFAWSGSRGTSFGAFRWFKEKAVLNQHIFNVFPKNGFEKNFAFQLLRWLTIEIERKAHGSAGLVHVTKKQLEDEKMNIPISLEEQTAIANVLQYADTEIQLLKNKLTQLKEQKKGLMQVLLMGKKRLKY